MGNEAARAQRSTRVGRRDQATFNGKRSDSSQNIAAVLAVIDPGLIDNNLSEQVIDIGVATQRLANDRNLARQ